MSQKTLKRKILKTTKFAVDSDSEDEKVDDAKKGKPDSVLHTQEIVESIKQWQNMRKRPMGISIESLFVGRKVEENLAIENDPFKLKTGGLVSMKGAFRKPAGDELEDEVRLSKTFAAETNKRDEDADMLKYIDDELAKRKGIVKETSDSRNNPASSILTDIPENLKPVIGQLSEDMLSSQMLCGIPEVDLGVESKMRNIEATEEAKQRLLQVRFSRRQKMPDEDIVPANFSVNFVQHSRWNGNIDSSIQQELAAQLLDAPSSTVPPIADPPAFEAERQRLKDEKSTDALALQRYKNYMRNRRPR